MRRYLSSVNKQQRSFDRHLKRDMHASRFLAPLFLCSVIAAKDRGIQSVPVELDSLQGRQVENGLNCITDDVVIVLQDLLGDPEATSYCSR